MRYKTYTPDAQKARAYQAAFREAHPTLFDNPPQPKKPVELSKYMLAGHLEADAEAAQHVYLCGVFSRAAERYTNYPRRWIFFWWSTAHPPRVCKGKRT